MEAREEGKMEEGEMGKDNKGKKEHEIDLKGCSEE